MNTRVLVVVGVCGLTGCPPPPPVAVPTPVADAPPVVTIAQTVMDLKGSCDPTFVGGVVGQNVVPNPEVNAQHVVCQPGTELLFTGIAKNHGGVKDLSLRVVQLDGVVRYVGSAVGTLSASGLAPDTLRVLAAGGDAMRVTVTGGNQTIFVEATAHNFNNQETKFAAEYMVP